MASLLDSFLGQQETPQLNTLSAQDILGSIYSSLPKLADINNTWNMNQAVGGAKAQNAAEDIYDPNRRAIRAKAGGTLLSELQNPYAMPTQLNQLLRQSGLEGAAGSGLNASDAGRAGMFGLLGAQAENRAQGLIGQGLGYGANTANLYNPQAAVTPGDVGSMTANANAQQNAFNTYRSNLDYQNSMNLINRPLAIGGQLGNIAGQIVGGVFGTNMGGSLGGMGGMFGGGSSAPQISPGTYGGPGQPSWNTVNWALPGRNG